jgi:hypothetical protein
LVTGACCGLGAFAIALVAGMGADNPGDVILFRAIISMLVCQFVGIGLGMIVERVVNESIQQHKVSRPAQVAGAAVLPPQTSTPVS